MCRLGLKPLFLLVFVCLFVFVHVLLKGNDLCFSDCVRNFEISLRSDVYESMSFKINMIMYIYY